jgi:hypothetical protein
MNRAMYPISGDMGYDLYDNVGKDKWLAIAVTLLKEKLGPDAELRAIRAEVASMLDSLHANKLVPHTLPKRFPRTVMSTQDNA